MSSSNEKATAKEMVIKCIEELRLKGVVTRHFTEFKRLQDLYGKQIEEKGRQLKEETVPTSYKASIEDEDLEIL